MADIEFVDEYSDGIAADDELTPRPQQGYPRWAIGAAVTLLVAGVVVAVASKKQDVPRQPTAADSSLRPAPTIGNTLTPEPRGLGLDLDGETPSEPVLAVAASARDSWVLRLSTIVLTSPAITRTSALSAPADFSSARLVVDRGADRLWAVFLTDGGATVILDRASTLSPVTQFGVGGVVRDVAALAGRLYLAVGDRILELAPNGAVRPLARPMAGVPVGHVVADPSRHRLLAVGTGVRGSRLWAVAVPSGAMTVRRVSTSIAVTLAVAGSGAIWLAGQDGGDGVLMALDPRTLGPTTHSALDPILVPRASLTAGGQHVVWVHDGMGSVLRCVDAATGNQLQSWSVVGPVASAAGAAVLGYGTRAVTLSLHACTG